MIYQRYLLEAGVPIGADWDPTKLSFYALISIAYAESVRGPGPMLIHTDSEDPALLFQEMAELLASYHRTVAPIQRIDISLNVPVAYTAKGSAVVLLPIDRLLRTERTSGIATSLARTTPKPPPVQHIEAWMTGDASVRAREGLQQLGIALVEHVGQRLPLLD